MRKGEAPLGSSSSCGTPGSTSLTPGAEALGTRSAARVPATSLPRGARRPRAGRPAASPRPPDRSRAAAPTWLRCRPQVQLHRRVQGDQDPGAGSRRNGSSGQQSRLRILVALAAPTMEIAPGSRTQGRELRASARLRSAQPDNMPEGGLPRRLQSGVSFISCRGSTAAAESWPLSHRSLPDNSPSSPDLTVQLSESGRATPQWPPA